ncbi:MAG: hydrogenase-1 expression HyaE [Pseudomonadota bacterium]
MSQALLDSLVDEPGFTPITADMLDAYLAEGARCATALFFTGDPEKKLETADVAVVLRELVRMYPGSLRVGIIARSDEKTLMKACKVMLFPSVAFFSGQKHLETIAKIQDWSVYEEKIPHILSRADAA